MLVEEEKKQDGEESKPYGIEACTLAAVEQMALEPDDEALLVAHVKS